MRIPLCVPDTGDEELAAIAEVMKSGWLAQGPKNTEFQEQFAEYIGVRRAVTVNSCTSALQLALEALAITGEVILPSFTFVASANAVVNAGAYPVFAEVDYDTCTLCPEDIVKRITKKTQAIMPVHFAGQCCRMDAIRDIARTHHLSIIEDSAQTIGGTYKERKAGSFGVGCFSFFPTKNMTTGEGGMFTTDDDALARKVQILAGHGIAKETTSEDQPWFREASVAGYNYRMSGLLAAIGIEQLKKIDAMNARRREHAAYLNKKLCFDEIELPVEAADCRHVYQMYTIKLKNINRNQFIRGLREKGVMASVHFTPPVHLQGYYREAYRYQKGDFPVTERLAETMVTLPMYPQMIKAELDYMVEAIGALLRDKGG